MARPRKPCRYGVPECSTPFEMKPWQLRSRHYHSPECQRLYGRLWRAKREAAGLPVRGVMKFRSDAERRKYARAVVRRWRERNRSLIAARDKAIRADPVGRIKYVARYMLRIEVRAGRVIKKPCEKCGSVKSQGHHKDYSRPLEVQWLCAVCHKKEHMEAHDGK